MSRQIHATDLSSLTQCDRQVYLNHHGDPALRVPPTRFQEWLRERGQQHEAAVVGTFEVEKPPYTYDNLEIGYEITLGLMREGVRMIYQGVLLDHDLVGIPDLLQRVEGPSKLGGWYYRPLDIKSASSVREGYRLQVMAYCVLLGSVQGVRPDGALLLRYAPDERVAGNLYREVKVAFDEELYRASFERVQELVGGQEARPFFSSACAQCVWREVCTPMVESAGDVSLVSGLRRDVWRVLQERGLGTLEALARVEPEAIRDIKGVGEKTAPQIITRARALARGEAIILTQPDLPPPGGEIIFDVESVPGEGIYYLMGTLIGDRYEHDLAEQVGDEGKMWWLFLQRISNLNGPIYHYGAYERMTVQKLAARHGGSEQARMVLARMIDLDKTLKACAVLPLRSDSLKVVAPWMGFAWMGEVEAGEDSMLEYTRWLEDRDRTHLERILRYNNEDCRATLTVLQWLRRLTAGEMDPKALRP